MVLTDFTKQLNEWGKAGTPFLFLIDFELQKPLAFTLDTIDPKLLRFNLNGFTNNEAPVPSNNRVEIQSSPIALQDVPVQTVPAQAFSLYSQAIPTIH